MEGKKIDWSAVQQVERLQKVSPVSLEAIYKRQEKIKMLIGHFNQIEQAKIAKKVLFNNELFQLGDCVQVYDATLQHPYVGRIVNFYILDPHIQLVPVVELAWCMQAKHLPQALRYRMIRRCSTKEVFLSDRIIYQYITCIKRKAFVMLLNQFVSIANPTSQLYYYRALFDSNNQQILPPLQTWPKQCVCQAILTIQEQNMIRCQCCSALYHPDCIRQAPHDGSQTIASEYRCERCQYEGLSSRMSQSIS